MRKVSCAPSVNGEPGEIEVSDQGFDLLSQNWGQMRASLSVDSSTEVDTKIAQATGFSGSYDDLTDVPSTFTPSAHDHDTRYYTETEVDALLAALPGGSSPIGCLCASVWRSVTMTNIGTSYKDVFSGVGFDAEHLACPDFTNATEGRIVYIWDYVGSGTQQVRIVDRDDNTNVLWESNTFTADQDGVDSGWFDLPAAFTGVKKLELQGKSTTAADDPVAKGYSLWLR